MRLKGDASGLTVYGAIVSSTNVLTGIATSCTTIPTLSGQVTNSGNAITLSNSAVIGKVLTGYTQAGSSQNVAATDTITQAIGKLDYRASVTYSDVFTGATSS